MIFLVAYNGGFRTLDDFEDLEVWQRIWKSSVPLWSVLITNFGVLIVCALMIESKRIFVKIPKKPVKRVVKYDHFLTFIKIVLLIILVMSVSSFILFLNPLDEVFYPGMIMVLFQNYNWVLLMIKPNDKLANLIHPYLHNSNEKKDWFYFKFNV